MTINVKTIEQEIKFPKLPDSIEHIEIYGNINYKDTFDTNITNLACIRFADMDKRFVRKITPLIVQNSATIKWLFLMNTNLIDQSILNEMKSLERFLLKMTNSEINSFVNRDKLKYFWPGKALDYSNYPSTTKYILLTPDEDFDIIEQYGQRMEEVDIWYTEQTIGFLPFDRLSVAHKLTYCYILIVGNGDFIFDTDFKLLKMRYLYIETDRTNLSLIKFKKLDNRFPKLRGFQLDMMEHTASKLDISQWNEFAQLHPKRNISITLKGVEPTTYKFATNIVLDRF